MSASDLPATEAKFFVASLLFRSTRDGMSLPGSPWEELMVLVRGRDADEAAAQARAIGEARERTQRNEDGVELAWPFFQVAHVQPLQADALGAGTPLFSRHVRLAEVAGLLRPADALRA